MTQLMPEMTTALRDLDTALDAPHATDPDVRSWRWSVRKQLSVVRDA
ncbi:MAG: hypothetical protein F2667_08300, partial [Actinobacteria bacterium]|nr:hypothetical protein [Actinomycetota bacterium]